MKRIAICSLIIAGLVSCGAKIAGAYCSEDGTCFDFRDGKSCVIAMGIDTGCFTYTKSGKNLCIQDPRKAEADCVSLKIVDANTLTSDFPFFEGTYKKKDTKIK
jgi:hypothetical protein